MYRRRGEHTRIANDSTTSSFRQFSRRRGHRLLRCGLAFPFLLSCAALASAQQLDITSVTPGSEAGPTAASIRIGLTPAAAVPVMFDYATMGGTATAGADYMAVTSVATIPAGNTNIVLNVPVLDDGIAEGTENFGFTISNPTGGATLGTDTALVNILDDEGAVTLDIGHIGSENMVSEADAGSIFALFRAVISAPLGADMTFDVMTTNGSATAGMDYVGASFTATIPAGSTVTSVPIGILDDALVEGTEDFTISISNPSGGVVLGTSSDTGFVLDDEGPVTLDIGHIGNENMVSEADAGSIFALFRAVISAPLAADMTFDVMTTNGSATAGQDYVASSFTATIPAGSTVTSLPIGILDDALSEATEDFTISVSNPSGGVVLGTSSDTGFVLDDDPLPAFSVSDVVMVEGDAGTTNANFVISLSAPSGQTVSVQADAVDNTAVAGSDYIMVSVPALTFSPGETALFFPVQIIGDTLVEPNETFFVNLTAPTNATIADAQGIGTIQNDDAGSTITINDVVVVEGDAGSTSAVFTVTMTPAQAMSIPFNYFTANGSASSGSDYGMASGSLSFAAGQTARTITINVSGDTDFEPDETFFVNISTTSPNAAVTDSQGVGTIQNDDAQPSATINDVSVVEGDAGTTNATFTVSLSNASSQAITVDYATAGVSATAGTDFQSTSGTLNFSPGQVSRTLTVLVNGDTVAEPDETFHVNLSSAVNATIADNQGLGTIQNDEGVPGISINDVSVVEGDAGMITAIFALTLSNPSAQTITVDYATADVTATAGSDYVAESATLTFMPGVTSIVGSIVVLGDVLSEGDETYHFNLISATNAVIIDSTGVGTIQDDDPLPAISISDVAVAEGDVGTVSAAFNVTLSNPSAQTITVGYATANGSATLADNDYQMASGTLTFTPGQVAQVVNVTVNGDTVFEGNETFLVDLSGEMNATIADNQAVGTINNDDAQPTIDIADVVLAEGNAATSNAVFNLTLSNPSSQTITVDYTTADGTATLADNDYQLGTGTATFTPGQAAQTITVLVNGDLVFEADETFDVNLSGATNATIGDGQGVGTIQNDDGQPSISITDPSVVEGNAGTVNLSYAISLSNPSAQTVDVDYGTADGTATLADNDYQNVSGTLTFTPGQTVAVIIVQVNGDLTFEGDETVLFDLTNPTNATIADNQGVGTIQNDDGQPSLSIDDVSLAEGDAGQANATFTVTLSNPSAQAVNVDFVANNGTATVGVDFDAAAGTLTWNPGETVQTLNVAINGDLIFEGDETFSVDLANAVNATIADNQGAGTIQDDDSQPAIAINDANLAEGNAGTSNMSFDVTLTNPSAMAVTVDFATADSSATLADNDYQNTSGTLTFTPGQTALSIQVPINGDPIFEPDETFDVDLSNPGGGSIADSQGVGTILNDDGMPSMAIDNVALAEGNAGTVQATFTVSLTVPTAQMVTVDFTTNDGTASVADSDYSTVSGTLSFAPGQTAMSIAVPVSGDTRFEPDEGFTVDLSNVSGATLGIPQGMGTIQNDDPLPAASIDDINIAEGDSGQTAGTFTVSLSNPSALPVDIDFATADDSATLGDNDYQMATGTVSFAADETSRTIAVQVNGDVTFEGDEAFFVDLSGAVGATLADAQGTATILNDDGMPSIAIGDVSVAEGNAGQTTANLAVTLTIPSAQPVTVDWATGENTATLADGDFQPGGGSLVFAPGETAMNVPVQVLGDLRFEPDESFFVNLTNAAGGSLGDPQGEVTITNDDPLPTLAIDDLVVIEGDSGAQTATFTVTLSNPSSQPVTVGFATSDGSATVAEGDYTGAAGTLTFAPDTLTQPVDVQVRGDTAFEDDEVFFVDLQGPNGATLGDGQGQLTIVNDDVATTPSFVIDDVQVTEGDSGTVDAVFTVTLSAPDTTSYSVDYATADGTASAAGGDYATTAGTVTISADASGLGTQTVRVPVNGDTVAEGDETFSVVLTNPSAGAVLVDDRGEATIEDDDQAPALVMNIGDISLAEGDVGTTDAIFTLSLSAPPTAPLAVDFATADGSATVADGDYQQKSGRITFNEGQQSRTVTVFVNGDTRVEGDETFALLLSNPSGVGLGDDRGEATLLDDDSDGVPTLTIRDGQRDEGDAGSQDLLFEVSLTPASTATVTVEYSTADGTATVVDGDYDPASGQLTFAPGVTLLTLAVPVRGDLRQEGDETFFVDLGNPVGANLADDQAVGTIVDDDDSTGGPQPALSIGNARVSEGDSGSSAASFTVSLSTPSTQSVSVTYNSRDGSARVADGDYQPTSGQLTFAPGQQRAVLTVLVNGDLAIERDETFFVDLSNPVGATLADAEGRGLIDNDDQPLGQVRLVAAGPVSEGDGTAVIEVERFGALGRAVEVTVEVSAGTATAGEDFTALSAAVRWSSSERGRRSVEVSLADDNRIEAEETLLVQLTNPVNATLENPSQLELVIVDDDKPTGLEVVGDREILTEVQQGVTLQARVVGQDGAPIAGAAVAWSLEGDAELESSENTLSDDEGLVSQRLALGRLPGRVRVTAALVEGDAEVVYTIVAEGNLGTASQGSEMLTVADVLDRSCVDAEGMLRTACEYVYTLPSGAQQRVLTELDPVAETQAQSDLALQAPQAQLRNITARLSALRGGAISQVVEQLAFNIQGDPLSLGMVRSAVADYGKDRNRYAAALQTALDRARGLHADGVDASDLRGGAASSDEQYSDVESAPRWGVFLNGSASFGDRPQLGQEIGFDFETQGITAGVDVRLSDRFVLGVAAGLLDTDIDVARDGGGVDASGYALSLYGTYYRERYYIDAIATYGWSDYDLVRNLDLPVAFMGRSRYVARAEPGSEQVSLGLGGGYDFQLETLRLTTFARASYVDAEVDAYTERGAGPFNLRLGSQSITSLLSEAGVELAYPWSVGWGVIQPSLRASYLHEFDDDSRLVRGRFAADLSGNEFVVETGQPDRDYFNLGVGLSFVLPRDLSFFILYDTDLERDDLDVYTLSGGIRYQF